MQGVRPDSHGKNWGSKNLHILYFNARSLYPKIDELCAHCDIEKPDVVCLTETWLCADILESECAIPGYQCVRCDRNRHGGGIALFISNNFEFQVTMLGPRELEFLLVSLHNVNNAHQKVHIGLWYRPPDKNTALDDLYSVIENLDVGILSSFVLLGDFNIDFCKQHHPLFSKLSIFIQSFELT